MIRDKKRNVGRKQKVIRDLGCPPTILFAGTAVGVFDKHEDNVLFVHHFIKVL